MQPLVWIDLLDGGPCEHLEAALHVESTTICMDTSSQRTMTSPSKAPAAMEELHQ